MDLLTPTDHAGAYEWASVFLAHFALGLGLSAGVAALLDWFDHRSGTNLDVGDLAPFLVTVVYLVAWEMGVQRLGAGWPDALIDTTAIASGGYAGLFLWRRAGLGLSLALIIAVWTLWQGVGVRT